MTKPERNAQLRKANSKLYKERMEKGWRKMWIPPFLIPKVKKQIKNKEEKE